MVDVDELHTHPENPRKGDTAAIRASMEANGFWGVVVAQSETNTILVGNHRYMVAKELGIKEVPVMYVDVNDTEAKRIMLADNRVGELGDTDKDLLASLLEGLDALDGTGYDQDFLDDLFAETAPDKLDLEIDEGASGQHVDRHEDADAFINQTRIWSITLSAGELQEFVRKVADLRERYGLSNATEVILKVVEDAHSRDDTGTA